MKVINLKLNGKTHATGKITTYLSKEALKIQKDSITLAKKGTALQTATADDMDLIESTLDELVEIKVRKSWLICETFGNKFSIDELEKNLADDEIDELVNKIISGICGIVTKN